MTPEQLRKNDRGWALAMLMGGGVLLWHLGLSLMEGVARHGWMKVLLGPVLAHKLSELLLLALWMPVLWRQNYERAGVEPPWLTPVRYRRFLWMALMLAPVQVVLATFAWTVANFGTHPLTTGWAPLVLREDGWVWRFYLGVLVLAGMAFVPVAVRALLRLESSPSSEVSRD